MRNLVPPLAFALFSLCLVSGTLQAEGKTNWYDGLAEVNGYALTQPRYRKLRKGQAVLIYVTEPFSITDRVKADPGKHPESDVVPVMKLNLVKDFQTGIYDYNVMTSAFVPMVDKGPLKAGALAKLSFSSQEWCGMLHDELIFGEKRIKTRRLSYFDGDSEPNGALPHTSSGMSLDQLFISVRGIMAPWLKAGEERRMPLLPSIVRSRLWHQPFAWTNATIRRKKATEQLTVPAGTFEVSWTEVKLDGGDQYAFAVEAQAPHRLVVFRGPDGEEGRMSGSKRLPYWQLSGPEGVKYLKDLGF